MSSPDAQKDYAEAKKLRAERMERARLRCLKLRQDEPNMPTALIAERVGVGKSTVVRWLRAAGLAVAARGRWP